jgi:hypothetical protein
MKGAAHTGSAPASPDATERLPNVFVRWLWVFVSPGRLFERLRERPEWGAALLLSAALVAISFLAIPPELTERAFREQMLRAGSEVPAGFQLGRWAMVAAAAGYAISTIVWSFALAALLTFVFAFLLGDDARFVEYLAVVTHAMLISATGSLLVTPLRIIQQDLLLSLDLGLFIPLDPESYASRVLRQLELFWLWGFLVMGLGVSKIDPRRGWAGAASFLLVVAVCLAMLIGLFRPPGT